MSVEQALETLRGYFVAGSVEPEIVAAHDVLAAAVAERDAAEAFATHDPGVNWPSDRHTSAMDAIMAALDATREERDRLGDGLAQERARPNGVWDQAAYEQLAADARQLREALEPFGTDVEAFDNADGSYGDGPVFERLSGDAHWSFTLKDVRRARAALRGHDPVTDETCTNCDGRGHNTAWPHTTCPVCKGTGRGHDPALTAGEEAEPRPGSAGMPREPSQPQVSTRLAAGGATSPAVSAERGQRQPEEPGRSVTNEAARDSS